jgi:hypothetical protein
VSENLNLGPCIVTGSHKDKDGYGKRYVPERRNNYAEHRVAYCQHHGLSLKDIKGSIVRHKCDNPGCVNPEHLELGSQADNIRDRDERGHTARGTQNWNAKLTEEQVMAIRSIYRKRNKHCGAAALAIRYGVSASAIEAIARRETWVHVA